MQPYGPQIPEDWRLKESVRERQAHERCSCSATGPSTPSSSSSFSGSDDESSEYDELEERRRACLRGRDERRRLNRERREMLGELRKYQWYQEAWRAGEADLSARKARLQTEEERSWADDMKSKIKDEQAEAAAEKLLDAMAKADLYGSDEAAALWAAHEEKWVCFSQQLKATTTTTTTISYGSIPWPPCVPGVLSAMAAVELSHLKQGRVASSSSKEAYVAHRRAFRKAHLRWHPDKFLHRFGTFLKEKDRQRIKDKVEEISQAINHAWSKMNNPAS